jgi:hypothetical protein
MSFVDRYLPYFSQQLIIFLLSTLLPYQPLFLKVHEISSLLLPRSYCAFGNSIPLLCVSFQFLVYCSVFWFFAGDVQSAQGAMLVYPRGGCRKTS